MQDSRRIIRGLGRTLVLWDLHLFPFSAFEGLQIWLRPRGAGIRRRLTGKLKAANIRRKYLSGTQARVLACSLPCIPHYSFSDLSPPSQGRRTRRRHPSCGVCGRVEEIVPLLPPRERHHPAFGQPQVRVVRGAVFQGCGQGALVGVRCRSRGRGCCCCGCGWSCG